MMPKIGIPVDCVVGTDPGRSPLTYRQPSQYAAAVAAAGGVPILLPYAHDMIPAYVEMLDGLLIAGGGFDVHPQHYGQAIQHDSVQPLEPRTQFELALTRAFFPTGKPILGVCGGHQLLNVFGGGTLVQDIPHFWPQAICHAQSHSRFEGHHDVTLVPGGFLHQLLGTTQIHVNSVHHQAIDVLAPDFVAEGYAPDQTIEAIRHRMHPFCIGTQWHPEFGVSALDRPLFQAFVHHACR